MLPVRAAPAPFPCWLFLEGGLGEALPVYAVWAGKLEKGGRVLLMQTFSGVPCDLQTCQSLSDVSVWQDRMQCDPAQVCLSLLGGF